MEYMTLPDLNGNQTLDISTGFIATRPFFGSPPIQCRAEIKDLLQGDTCSDTAQNSESRVVRDTNSGNARDPERARRRQYSRHNYKPSEPSGEKDSVANTPDRGTELRRASSESTKAFTSTELNQTLGPVMTSYSMDDTATSDRRRNQQRERAVRENTKLKQRGCHRKLADINIHSRRECETDMGQATKRVRHHRHSRSASSSPSSSHSTSDKKVTQQSDCGDGITLIGSADRRYNKGLVSREKNNVGDGNMLSESKEPVEHSTKTDQARREHVPDPSGRKEKRELDDDEGTTDTTAVNVFKKSRRGASGSGASGISSLQNAIATVSREMKSASRKVVMEDENIIINQEIYTVVYKNASDVYKHFENEVKKTLKEAKKNLVDIVDRQLKEFDSRLGRMMDKKMSRIRRVTAENGKDVDTHSFVIITPKPQVEGLFHMTTAFDRNDLDKKINRTKSIGKLVLEFNSQREFNFSQLKNILKQNKLLAKTKHDISYESSDLKRLQVRLVNAINSSPEYRISTADYTLTYSAGDLSPPKSRSTSDDGGKRKAKKRKIDIERSMNEQHTDVSDADGKMKSSNSNERRDISDSEVLCERSEEEFEEGGESSRREGLPQYVKEDFSRNVRSSAEQKQKSERKRKRSSSSTEVDLEEQVVDEGMFYE